VKICGVRSAEIARAAAECGADAVGLVFAAASPRHVTLDQAAEIRAALPPLVHAVGLFVTPDAVEIREHAARLSLSMVQLHGRQDPALIESLWPVPILYALHFDADAADQDLHRWDQLHRRFNHLSGLLIDTADGARAGGTGRSFDWPALRAAIDRVRPAVPIVLAGGLTPGNVGRAVQVVRPWAVDVSSGVETSPGVKDPGLIRDFCQSVASAGRALP
jgi:phosphoribosylanthranilate isomerase